STTAASASKASSAAAPPSRSSCRCNRRRTAERPNPPRQANGAGGIIPCRRPRSLAPPAVTLHAQLEPLENDLLQLGVAALGDPVRLDDGRVDHLELPFHRVVAPERRRPRRGPDRAPQVFQLLVNGHVDKEAAVLRGLDQHRGAPPGGLELRLEPLVPVGAPRPPRLLQA